MNFKAEGRRRSHGAEGGCHGRKAFDLQCTRNSEVAHILCLPFLVAAKHTGIRGFDIDDCGTCGGPAEGSYGAACGWRILW